MSQDCLKEVFKVARGYLLRFSAFQPTNGPVQIRLEQFLYSSNRFELFTQEYVTLKSKTQSRPRHARIDFFRTSTKSVICLFIQFDEQERFVVVSQFDENTSKFIFNDSLMSLLDNFVRTLQPISYRDVYFKFNSKFDKFVAFALNKSEIVIASNESNYGTNISLANLNGSSEIGQLCLVKMVELTSGDEMSLLSTKIIIFLKLESKSTIKMLPVLIDIESKKAYPVDCRQFFGEQFIHFHKSDSRLLESDFNPTSTHLDQVFFMQINKPRIDASLDIDIVKIKINAYKIGINNGSLVLSGDCYLVVKVNQEFEMILVQLKHGSVVNKLKLTKSIAYDKIKFVTCDDTYLVAKKAFSFNIYNLNQNGRLVCESLESQCIDFGFFAQNTNKSKPYYLYIFDWTNANYEMRDHLFEQQQQEQQRNDSYLDEQVDSLIDSLGNNNHNNFVEKKEGCIENLVKALAAKQRLADVILNEASIELQRKLALISELTNLYSLRSTDSSTLALLLPRLVEFYSSGITCKTSRIDKKAVNGEHFSRFKLQFTWTCHLNGCFSFNFVFLNNSNKSVSDLNCVVLVGADNNPYIELEYKQLLLKLSRPILDKLASADEKSPNELDATLFERLLNESLISDTSTSINVEPNGYVLITLRLTQEMYESLLSQSPNGCFKINIHMNSICDSNLDLFKQDVPVFYDVFQNFVQIDRFNIKTFFTLLNIYRSCFVCRVEIKCMNIKTQVLCEHLNKLGFECVYRTSNHTPILHGSKQCLFSNAIVILMSDENNVLINILGNTTQQVNALICALDKSIKEDSSESRLHINLNSIMDKLIESINNEIRFHNYKIGKLENEMEVDNAEREEINGWLEANIMELEKKTDDLIKKFIR